MDAYETKARLAPAVLAAAPVLVAGIAALPILEGAQRLWTIVSLGLMTYAALIARRAGYRIQPALIDAWGGFPTTSRMRFADNPSVVEVERRHGEVERILAPGLRLPSADEEKISPQGADNEYEAAMKRVVAMARDRSDLVLLHKENGNYGFARNLLGLKRLAVTYSWLVLVISAATCFVLFSSDHAGSVRAAIAPFVASALALLLWHNVDFDFVRPSAEAYADRLVDAFPVLP